MGILRTSVIEGLCWCRICA